MRGLGTQQRLVAGSLLLLPFARKSDFANPKQLMKNTYLLLLLGLVAVVPAFAQENKDAKKWDINKLDASKLPAPAAQAGVSFTKDIEPIFKASCERCHGDEQQKGGLRLDTLEATLKGGKAGKMVVPGDSAKSLIVLAVCQQDDGTAMPPKRRPRGPGGPAGGPANSPGGPGRGPGGPDGQGVAGPGGQVVPPAEGGPGGPPGGGPGRGGPPAKPLTTEQVALVRAWIDQGAK